MRAGFFGFVRISRRTDLCYGCIFSDFCYNTARFSIFFPREGFWVAKILEVGDEKVTVRLDDGREKQLARKLFHFTPHAGDRVRIYRDEEDRLRVRRLSPAPKAKKKKQLRLPKLPKLPDFDKRLLLIPPALILIILIISGIVGAVRTSSAHQAYAASFRELGGIVTFGTYEQDNDLTNGAEAIEWQVIALDGSKALLLSRCGLDAQPYNTSSEEVTWADCTLRTWLNETFCSTAFTAAERKALITTEVYAEGNANYDTDPGLNTQDTVFLLSVSEIETCFASDRDRMCTATAYAKANGCYAGTGTGYCWWWLRNPGSSRTNAVRVTEGGAAYLRGDSVSLTKVAVRPAVWVDIEKL